MNKGVLVALFEVSVFLINLVLFGVIRRLSKKRPVPGMEPSLPSFLFENKSLRSSKAILDSFLLALDANSMTYYYSFMIRTFRCKETEMLFKDRRSTKLPPDIRRVALRKLVALHSAPTLRALRIPPANHLEALSGDREGQYSIRVNDRWRICFAWNDGNAYDVEIVDYH